MKSDFDPYNVPFRGGKLDTYRVIDLFQISHPALQQAAKKILRCGGKHKTTAQDVVDAISSLQRWQEMEEENRRFENQPELPGFEIPGLDEMLSLTPFELEQLREFDERHNQRVNGHESEEYVSGVFRCGRCGIGIAHFTKSPCKPSDNANPSDFLKVE